MNSLKTVLVGVILAAIAYGVYVSINRNPETASVPEDAPAWPGVPEVQLPGTGTPGGQSPGSGVPNVQILGAGAPNGQIPRAGASAVPGPRPPVSNNQAPRLGVAKSPLPGPTAGGGGVGKVPPPAGSQGSTSRKFTLPDNPIRPVAPLSEGKPNLRAPSALPSPAESPAAAPPAGRLVENGPGAQFTAYMQFVQEKLDRGQLDGALLALTKLSDNPGLTLEQSRKVIDLLDRLAGTVIYSRQHLLEGGPYVVKPNETLQQIARQYDVPWILLARINGIRPPYHLQLGQELKVVRGPFNAVIDLSKYELTMMLHGRYAGRFPIGIGTDHANLEGTYLVRDQIVNPQYYGPNQVEIDADDPNNPLGEHWIGLGGQIGIHGTNDPANVRRTGGRGSICLGNRDIDDVFGILSIGSRVIIRR